MFRRLLSLPTLPLCGLVVAIGAVAAAVILVATEGRRPPAEARQAPAYAPRVGEKCRAEEGCPACDDYLAAGEAARSARLGDDHGLTQLLQSGRVYQLANGTPVLVLGLHTIDRDSWVEARILAGRHEGRKAYLPADLLHPY